MYFLYVLSFLPREIVNMWLESDSGGDSGGELVKTRQSIHCFKWTPTND